MEELGLSCRAARHEQTTYLVDLVDQVISIFDALEVLVETLLPPLEHLILQL